MQYNAFITKMFKKNRKINLVRLELPVVEPDLS